MKPLKILVIAAHPDDEVLGCGATIKKWTADGSQAYALILAQGITSRSGEADVREKLEALKNDSLEASRIVGYKTVLFEEFPDNRMDSVDLLDVIHKIEAYIEKMKPEIIFTHHHADLNIDHRITYEAVITACRPHAGSSVKSIYSFQIPSSTEWHFPYHKNAFSPNTFVDVTKTVQTKIAAFSRYKSEIRETPHPRSAEIIGTIAKQWGSVANMEYAEAFELIYAVVK